MINFFDLKEKRQDILVIFTFAFTFKICFQEGRFRLRYLPKSYVPVACDISELDDNLVVVDLIKAEVCF